MHGVYALYIMLSLYHNQCLSYLPAWSWQIVVGGKEKAWFCLICFSDFKFFELHVPILYDFGKKIVNSF